MPKTKSPRSFPAAGDGLTTHTYEQLTMSTDTPRGGFRVWTGGEIDHLMYVVEKPQERYSVAIITARKVQHKTQDTWRSRIKPHTHRLTPAEKWRQAAWESYQRDPRHPSQVKQVVARLEYQHLHQNEIDALVSGEAEVVAHG